MRFALVTLTALVLVFGLSVSAPAGEEGGKKAKVQLPEATAKAVKDAFPEAKVLKVGTETEDGVALYEVELRQGKAEFEVAVSADGVIAEVAVEIKPAELPEAVTKTVGQEAPGAKIKEAEKVEVRAEVRKDDKGVPGLVKLEKPRTVYEVEVVKDKREGEITVDPDGKVVKKLSWAAEGGDKD
jgi:uncharacterized membrane protein YkoI